MWWFYPDSFNGTVHLEQVTIPVCKKNGGCFRIDVCKLLPPPMFYANPMYEIMFGTAMRILGLLVNPVFMQPYPVPFRNISTKPSIACCKPETGFGMIGHPILAADKVELKGTTPLLR
jgi:hypothetical protein